MENENENVIQTKHNIEEQMFPAATNKIRYFMSNTTPRELRKDWW